MSAVTTMADWALRCLDPAVPKAAREWGTERLRLFRDHNKLPTVEDQAAFDAQCKAPPVPTPLGGLAGAQQKP